MLRASSETPRLPRDSQYFLVKHSASKPQTLLCYIAPPSILGTWRYFPRESRDLPSWTVASQHGYVIKNKDRRHHVLFLSVTSAYLHRDAARSCEYIPPSSFSAWKYSQIESCYEEIQHPEHTTLQFIVMALARSSQMDTFVHPDRDRYMKHAASSIYHPPHIFRKAGTVGSLRARYSNRLHVLLNGKLFISREPWRSFSRNSLELPRVSRLPTGKRAFVS